MLKPGNIKKAKEQVKIAQANEEEYFIQLASMVKNRYFVYLQYQKSLVPVNNAYIDAKTNFESIKVKIPKRRGYRFWSSTVLRSQLNQAYQTKLQTEASYLSAKAALEELTVTQNRRYKIMDQIFKFLHLLKKYRLTLIIVPIVTIVITFFLVRNLPNSYVSQAQISTGIVDETQQQSVFSQAS